MICIAICIVYWFSVSVIDIISVQCNSIHPLGINNKIARHQTRNKFEVILLVRMALLDQLQGSHKNSFGLVGSLELIQLGCSDKTDGLLVLGLKLSE